MAARKKAPKRAPKRRPAKRKYARKGAAKAVPKDGRTGGGTSFAAPKGTTLVGLHKVYSRTVAIVQVDRNKEMKAFVLGKKGGLMPVPINDGAMSGYVPVTSSARALEKATYYLDNFPV